MSTEFTGTISANGVKGPITCEPRNRIFLSLALAVLDEQDGRIVLERSENGGNSWEAARDEEGTEMVFDGVDTPLADTVAAATILNDTSKKVLYRLFTTGFSGDDVEASMTQVVGDAVEVVLSDSSGRPLVSVRDDGGLIVHGIVAGDNEQGDITFAGVINADAITTEEDEDGFTVVANGEGWTELVRNQTIASADITGVGAGQFGHAAGVPLVANPGAGAIVELISCLLINDRAVAAYTAGGNITVNRNGGAAATGLVSAANSLGNAADTRSLFVPLAAAAEVLADNKGLNLVSSAAFTQPGTAAGVLRVRTRYRVHTTGL